MADYDRDNQGKVITMERMLPPTKQWRRELTGSGKILDLNPSLTKSHISSWQLLKILHEISQNQSATEEIIITTTHYRP